MDEAVPILTNPSVMVSVGIDVAEARKGLDLVALNTGRGVVRSEGRLTPQAVVQVIRELRPTVVCLDSPPRWSSGGRSRVAERALGAVGIHSYATGPDPGDNPFYGWMRVGARLFDELADAYPRYRGGAVEGTAAEIFPHATALLLAGRQRHADENKMRFRRSVLDTSGVSSDWLPTQDRVDAALAALTGLVGLEGRHGWVGDPDEGVILLPTPLPQTRFVSAPRRSASQRPSCSPGGYVCRASSVRSICLTCWCSWRASHWA